MSSLTPFARKCKAIVGPTLFVISTALLLSVCTPEPNQLTKKNQIKH